MKSRIIAVYFVFYLVMLMGIPCVLAQTAYPEPAQNVTQMQSTVSVSIGDQAFKEWLLADTNAQISRLGVFAMVAFIVACVFFGAGLWLIMACCRKHAGAKCLFDKFKLENCQNEGRFGMFVYDFRKERIKTSGRVCAMLGLDCGRSLPLDAYLRLMHHGQDITDYEKCHAAELVYEREADIVFFSLYTFPIVNKHGQLVGEYGLLQDVSLFRRRELDYRMRRDEAKEAFDSVEAYITGNPLHAMVLHDDFDIIRMNRAAVDILGADEEELYSLCFKDMLADKGMVAAFAAHMRHAVENGFALGDFSVYDKNHDLRQVEIYTSRFKTTGNGDLLNSSLRIIA